MLYAAFMVAAKVVKKAWYVCKARNDIGIAMNIPFLGEKHSHISLENTEKKSQNLQNQQ